MYKPKPIELFLKKFKINREEGPDKEKWVLFLEKVETLVRELQERKDIVENTLSVSTTEMERLYLELQKKSESEIAKSELLFRTLFDVSPFPLIIFEGEVTKDCNKAAVRVLEAQTKEDVLSLPFRFFFETDAILHNSLEKVQPCEFDFKTLAGNVLPVEIIATRMMIDGQNGILLIWRDLTEERSQRAQIIQSSKLASLGEMSAGIAHEINNPLAVIIGHIPHLIKHRDDLSKFESKIDAMRRSALRIEKIVSGLRKFSRSSHGQVHKLYSIKEIVTESIVITGAKANDLDIPLTTTVPEQLQILCDNIEIEQVLINLINNGMDAIKTLDERWIKVNVFSENNQIVLQVHDSGPGIPIEIEKKFLLPFFTTKPPGEGTGLGLSISKGILDQHNATFSLNRTFKNTCFEIRFPIPSENIS